jgi:hypothetical protein
LYLVDSLLELGQFTFVSIYFDRLEGEKTKKLVSIISGSLIKIRIIKIKVVGNSRVKAEKQEQNQSHECSIPTIISKSLVVVRVKEKPCCCCCYFFFGICS